MLESVSTYNWAAVTEADITKPSGLAVGDRMIAVVGSSDSSAMAASAGWSTIANPVAAPSGPARLSAYYKTATSDDVAASTFKFYGGSQMSGFIARISSPGVSAPLYNAAQTTLTPYVNSIFIMALCHDTSGGGAATVSGYNMATNDPTWTERIDNGIVNSFTFAVATATRAEATATGEWGASPSIGGNTAWILIAQTPIINVTNTPTVFSATVSVQAPTIITGSNIPVSVVSATIGINAPTIIQNKTEFTNVQKTAAPTVTNVQKTAAPTITNVQKSAAPTVTNVQKHE